MVVNMAAENISQEFRLKNKAKTQKKFITEINQNELMSNKHKKSCTVLNYIEHLLILASAVTGWVSISAFALLVGISIGITVSVAGLKICAITAGIKKYKSKINKTERKHGKIVLLTKAKLSSIEFLVSRDLIDTYSSQDEFVSEEILKKKSDI